MDQPVGRAEEPEEREVSPSEVWEQLSPDLQARIVSLLAKMAYKCALAQHRTSSEKRGKDMGNIPSSTDRQDESGQS